MGLKMMDRVVTGQITDKLVKCKVVVLPSFQLGYINTAITPPTLTAIFLA